jgi:hypothetical protein
MEEEQIAWKEAKLEPKRQPQIFIYSTKTVINRNLLNTHTKLAEININLHRSLSRSRLFLPCSPVLIGYPG